jgi:DNA-binding MarR family transcriptional regulator
MKTELLHNLIDLVEEFNKISASDNMEDFVIWLSGKYFESEESDIHKGQLDLMLAFQISILNKSIKKHTKAVISASSLSSLDGYSFLLHLEQEDSFRKMELIEMHNLEAPTGIEIIKRMLSKGLIEEFNDLEDKRAKRVKMTVKGEKELEQLKPLVNAKFKNFAKALSLHDKLGLVATMNKLIRS